MAHKLIIAGSRSIRLYDTVTEGIYKGLIYLGIKLSEVNEIVSGGANGVDKLGEMFAKKNNIPIKQFNPNWSEYGKRAALMRNEAMAKYGTVLIAIWDGKSRGTSHMIDVAQISKLPVYIYLTNFM